MSQPAAAPSPPAVQPARAQPAPATAKKGFWPAPTGKPVGAGVENTPVLLSRLQIIGMAAVLLFGLASGLVQLLSYQSDGRAADDTEQLVRVQEIQSTLLRVDAIATNLVLIGGAGDPERDEEYDAALAEVFELIAAAAEAQPADKEALAALNVEVNDYATAIAEARANVRQTFPVGAEYLSGASTALDTDALPILANLVEANTERAEDSMSGQHPFWLLLIGVVATAVLVWMSMLVARRFRRFINVGIAVAGIIVVVTTLVASIAAWRAANQNDALLDEELRMAVDQAESRTAANDAKANESLRLIKRGSGATAEPIWETSAAVVEDKADRTILDEWESYVEAHGQIVRLDDTDRWGPAVLIAVGSPDALVDEETGEPYNSTAAFDAFDSAAAELVADNGKATTDELRAGRTLALVGSLLTLVLGFVAAVSLARGLGDRRKEYA
jgi:hypothetical protein